jgi:hypothetical protein
LRTNHTPGACFLTRDSGWPVGNFSASVGRRRFGYRSLARSTGRVSDALATRTRDRLLAPVRLLRQQLGATRRGSARSRTVRSTGLRTSSRPSPGCADASAACTARPGRTASRRCPPPDWRRLTTSGVRSDRVRPRLTRPRPRARTGATTKRAGWPRASVRCGQDKAKSV